MGKDSFYAKYIKRKLDIICALAAIVVFSWLYVILAILVYINLGKPVLFKQIRPGKDGKAFNLYKFRTMMESYNEDGTILPDEERLTTFGKILRSTSLDELPEAFNILRGDMSVVGPRPLLIQYLARYNDQQSRRHDVRPGLSGYAQIHGRNSVSWEEKFDMDLWYIEHLSFWIDVKIVIQSVFMVLKREGINSNTHATMEEFMGTKKEQKTKNSSTR